MLLLKTSQGFSDHSTPRSKRVGKMLETLALAMMDDDYRYFSIKESIGEFYNSASLEWNDLFIKNGGKLGSGKLVAKEIKGENHLEKIVGQYPATDFMQLQGIMAFVKNFLNDPDSKISRDEFNRMRILDIVISTVIMGIVMQESWFDTVERAINNSIQSPDLN